VGSLELDLSGIGWLIAGGESGSRRRPVELAWLRSLRDQCAAAGVPFHLKQIDKVAAIPPDLMAANGNPHKGSRSDLASRPVKFGLCSPGSSHQD
jgi:protein gp37